MWNCALCKQKKDHYICVICNMEIHTEESHHLSNEYAAHYRCELAESRRRDALRAGEGVSPRT